MMSTCRVCRAPTDYTISDVMTTREYEAACKKFNNNIPLIGVCGDLNCKFTIMCHLDDLERAT